MGALLLGLKFGVTVGDVVCFAVGDVGGLHLAGGGGLGLAVGETLGGGTCVG